MGERKDNCLTSKF